MHLSIQEVGISEYFLLVAKNEIGGIKGYFQIAPENHIMSSFWHQIESLGAICTMV